MSFPLYVLPKGLRTLQYSFKDAFFLMFHVPFAVLFWTDCGKRAYEVCG
jgi:hypothetical protein